MVGSSWGGPSGPPPRPTLHPGVYEGVRPSDSPGWDTNPTNQTNQTKPNNQPSQANPTKPTKPNQPNQPNQTKLTRPRQPNQPNQPNQPTNQPTSQDHDSRLLGLTTTTASARPTTHDHDCMKSSINIPGLVGSYLGRLVLATSAPEGEDEKLCAHGNTEESVDKQSPRNVIHHPPMHFSFFLARFHVSPQCFSSFKKYSCLARVPLVSYFLRLGRDLVWGWVWDLAWDVVWASVWD